MGHPYVVASDGKHAQLSRIRLGHISTHVKDDEQHTYDWLILYACLHSWSRSRSRVVTAMGLTKIIQYLRDAGDQSPEVMGTVVSVMLTRRSV